MSKLLKIIFSSVLIILGFLVYQSEQLLKLEIEKDKKSILETSHIAAIQNVESALSTYYFIVVALKAYTSALDSPPTAEELQTFIAEYAEKIHFKDSILLSFLDTNHQFVYTVGPKQIDPVGLTGFNVSWFRTDEEIAHLDSLLNVETINLNQPLNLVEGWPAIPFSFNLNYNNNIKHGYIAAVLDLDYLINKVYHKDHHAKTFHRFIVSDSIDFTNVAVYDHTTIYNEHHDSLYYKNNNLDSADFKYSTYHEFGRDFIIGTAINNSDDNTSFVQYLFEIYSVLALIILFLIWRLSFKNNKDNKSWVN